MRLERRRCGLLGGAVAFGLVCLDATCASAQSADLPCERPSSHGRLSNMLIDTTFTRPLNLFQQAGSGPPERATELYERAAAAMEQAIASHPNHRQAALASFYVALALERSGRPRSAMERYLRVTREYDTTRDAAGYELTGDDLVQRINVLEAATFRAAINAERTFDFDEAIGLYRLVVNDPRFANAAEHGDHVHDALASMAILQGRPDSPTRAAPPNEPTRWPNIPPDTLAMEAMSYATRLTVFAP